MNPDNGNRLLCCPQIYFAFRNYQLLTPKLKAARRPLFLKFPAHLLYAQKILIQENKIVYERKTFSDDWII